MATKPYELARLDADAFEHMINQIAVRVLGAGATGFAPGADGGRDGWFRGEAPYPSSTDRWSGTWYIQSKFHSPNLSGDAQKWLQKAVKKEIDDFIDIDKSRSWPDIWIIASNVDPSAVPKTGSHDAIISMISDVNPDLANKTHIWGGQKILTFLNMFPDIADYYGAFITPGQALKRIVDEQADARASVRAVLQNLVVNQFNEQQFTKLDQAGSTTDSRPGIHKLFIDLPIKYNGEKQDRMAMRELAFAASDNFLKRPTTPDKVEWRNWLNHPARSKVWFIRGGPGQGKSTVTQYICQVQRAALILKNVSDFPVANRLLDLATEVETQAKNNDYWPSNPRIPVQIELRIYAQWYGAREEHDAKGILSFLSVRLAQSIEQEVKTGTLKRAFSSGRWLFIFDGLDEVPGDVKDDVANEVINFSDNLLVETNCDYMVVCTSRPQGYSGQFDGLNPSLVDLAQLNTDEALRCALPVLAVDRGQEELNRYREILVEALNSPAIQEIMTTPLQSHIMAVVVRDGGRPPERKWQLFSNFYQVIKKREANRSLPDKEVARLLRQGDKLIKTLHNRLGFELHARAELSSGAQTSIDKASLRIIVSEIVEDLQEDANEETIDTLMRATTERLVLVSTPETGESVRFDIRPLQEFFAAEFLYETAPENSFSERLQIVAGDSHWREVLHFLISALVEQGRRTELAQAVQVLINLDNPIDGVGRPLARTLCIGGTITARLVREGVLEADKRVRHQFQPCTTSLFSATDARSLVYPITPPHSRAWFASAITSCLSENSTSENIGAATLAPIIMSSDLSGDMAVAEYVRAQSIEYRNAFIVKAIGRYNDNNQFRLFPDWLIKYSVLELLEQDWSALSVNALRALYHVVGIDQVRSTICMSDLGIPFSNSEIILKAFNQEDDIPEQYGDEVESLYGILSLRVSELPDVLNTISWSKDNVSYLSNMPGIFGIIARLALASANKNDVTIAAVCEAIPSIAFPADKLPALIQQLYLNHNEKDTFRLSNDKSTISLALRDTYPGKRRVIYYADREDDTVDWSGLAKDFPGVILHHFTRSYRPIDSQSLREWIDEDGSVDLIVESLKDDASYVSTIGDLGGLLVRQPRLGNAIKSLLNERMPRVWSDTRYMEYRPFSVDVPNNIGLLPYVLSYIYNSYRNRHAYNDADGKKIIASFSHLIKEFNIDRDELIKVAYSDDIYAYIRASAAVLVIGDDGADVQGDILECLSRMLKHNDCFEVLPAALAAVSDGLKSNNQAVIEFINDALAMSRHDLSVRMSLEPIILNWREITRAPVSSSRMREIWQ